MHFWLGVQYPFRKWSAFFKSSQFKSSLQWLVQLLNWLDTLTFGTLKGSCLQINSLASNNCFRCRHIFQNSINALSKMVNHFLSKSSECCVAWIIRLYVTYVWYTKYKYLLRNVRRALNFRCQHQQ